MKIFTKLLLIPLCFLGWGAALAQTTTYTGTVTEDSGDPLIGVNIFNRSDASGTTTDLDGRFELEAEAGDTIVLSYAGYESLTFVLGATTELDFELLQRTELLEEIVVVGYGSQKSKDLTSSIVTVDSDEILKTPSGQPMQALQGRVAGVQIVSAGDPGGAPAVRVRGLGSYNQGDAAPLYVVDGMFFDNIDFLNNNDIKSISVLKDASAAAIYGVRAANGVVLIETNSGNYDSPAQITYDGYYGVQVAQNMVKMANAEQFTTMALESGSEADISFIDNAMQRYGRSRINPNVPAVNTDWYDVITRNAPMTNHSINVTGGGSKAAYSVGTSYFSQEGNLNMKNEYERFNLRTKIDFKATDWFTIGGNAIFSNANRFLPENAAWFRAYYAVPIMPVFDENNTDATPLMLSNAQDLGYRGGQNPLVSTEFNQDQQRIRKLLGNFYVQFNILPDDRLTFKSAYNSSFTNINQRNLDFPYFIGNNFQRENSAISKTTSTFFNQIWDNFLTYEDNFGRHKLTAMVGSSYRDESFEQLRLRALNFPTDQEPAWFIDQAETLDTDRGNVGDNGSRFYGISYFGRIAYNFDNRYLLYGTYRADGTNKYQEKWGYFPTVGVGWVVSEERFFNLPWVDYLKFRASWGELGNDRIQASDGATTTSVIVTSLDDTQFSGTQTSNTFSALRWEVVEETNVGMTAEFLRSRLSVEADYYVRDTRNAAIFVNIPAIGGTVLRNVGEIRNSGFELAANWSQSLASDLSFSIGGNMATLDNEVLDLFGQPYIDGGSAEFRQRSIVGQPLLAFFGWRVAGVYQNQAEIDADPAAVANNLEPGDLRYVDQNGDGMIDADDRVVLGSFLPSFTFGANLNVSYKGFDLSANFYGQSGNKILNRRRGEVIFTNDTNMDAELAVNRWHGEGTSNEYPSSKGMRKGWNQRLSDYWVEDGAFWRIQNVQLAYNLDGEAVFGAGAPAMRISLTAERPLTVFDYNGFTAEVGNGVDRQTYPIPAVYTVGLNVRF